MLNKSLIFTATQRTLAFFCLHPGQEFHAREVARQVGISAAAAHGAIQFLLREKALRGERKGKMAFYRLVESRPLVRQYKTMAIVLALEPLLFKLRPITDQVYLYGSCATGQFLSGSDVDLLIVTSQEDAVHDVLSRFEERFPKEIRPVITSVPEWMKYEEKDRVFYEEVTRGILLYQSERYESEI
jgi:predicted nucleotidyltransferase